MKLMEVWRSSFLLPPIDEVSVFRPFDHTPPPIHLSLHLWRWEGGVGELGRRREGGGKQIPKKC